MCHLLLLLSQLVPESLHFLGAFVGVLLKSNDVTLSPSQGVFKFVDSLFLVTQLVGVGVILPESILVLFVQCIVPLS